MAVVAVGCTKPPVLSRAGGMGKKKKKKKKKKEAKPMIFNHKQSFKKYI